MGFYDDIMRIVKMLPVKRQTMLFSATMPPRIRTMANQILHQPKEVSIAVSRPADKIKQEIYFTGHDQKLAMTISILKKPEFESVIVFASSKDNAKRVNTDLRKAGLKTSAFHSDLEQKDREELMRDFKSRKVKILVGTDVLSRGIDVEGISLVLNYDVPHDPEDYIHRIGRTARAEESGVAITLVSPQDLQRFRRIEKLIGHALPVLPLPEEIGPAPDMSKAAASRQRQGRRPAGKGRPPRKSPGAGSNRP
ncbi:MAG: DEAD/DEAH box helicase, partial [Bacteroidia bacterium]|nr:DEAD/DEAH box helicase [Bacteroidia bacterium]